jgi:hypothetical protein
LRTHSVSIFLLVISARNFNAHRTRVLNQGYSRGWDVTPGGQAPVVLRVIIGNPMIWRRPVASRPMMAKGFACGASIRRGHSCHLPFMVNRERNLFW